MCLRTPHSWIPVSALVDEAGFESCDIVCKSNYFLFITHIPHFDYTIIYLIWGMGDCCLIVVSVLYTSFTPDLLL